MFKDRSFLIGLGAGLVVGALLLQMTIGVKDANNKALLTEQEVRQLAGNKGFIMITQIEFNELKAKTAAAVLTPKASDSPKPSAPASTLSPSAAETASPTATPPPAPNVLSIYIADGMGSKEVAAYLTEVGVIVDRVAFEQRIKEKGVEAKLKKGAYSMKPNMQTDEVINVLTHNTN